MRKAQDRLLARNDGGGTIEESKEKSRDVGKVARCGRVGDGLVGERDKGLADEYQVGSRYVSRNPGERRIF